LTRRARRAAQSILDAVLALALIGAGLVPLLELIRSNVATVRPRAVDFAVANLAADFLERLAARPRLPDELANRLAPGVDLTGPQLASTAAEIAGDLPVDISKDLAAAGVSFRVERTGTRFTSWSIQARWKDGEHARTRRFARITSRE
jgi:hypothetical protein